MRHIIILLFLFSYSLSAQTSKGSFLVGGNATADFSESNYEVANIKSISFNLNLKAAFFMIDNLCIGASIPFSIGNTKYSYYDSPFEYDTDASSMGFGPFVRYYFLVNKLQIITEAGYSWNKVNSQMAFFDPVTGEASYTDLETDSKVFQAASGVGLLLSKSVALEFLLNFQNLDSETDNANPFGSNDFKRNRLFISVGFQFYIPKISE